MTQTVGRIGAIVGAVVLAQTASIFWDPECGRDAGRAVVDRSAGRGRLVAARVLFVQFDGGSSRVA